MGVNLDVDEQTIGFQGKSGFKLRIKFKREGDGFMCDSLCDDGYTYTCFFWNHPAPPIYLEKGFSTLHARDLSLFETLEDNYHHVGMDNL